MIGKMIKHEFKATWKYMCILFLCACIISAGIFAAVELGGEKLIPMTDDFGNVLDYVSEAWAFGTAGSACMMMAAIVLVICFGITRFKRVLTAEDGYLVNTLPVGTKSIIISKAITFFAYAIPLIGLTFAVFFSLIFNGKGGIMQGRLFGELAIATNAFNPTGEQIANFAMSAVKSLVSGIAGLLQLYAAMAIGFSFNRHKGLWSLGAFFAIVFGSELVAEVLTPIRNRIYNITPMRYEDIVEILGEIVIAVVFYLITYYFMSRRLNVE